MYKLGYLGLLLLAGCTSPPLVNPVPDLGKIVIKPVVLETPIYRQRVQLPHVNVSYSESTSTWGRCGLLNIAQSTRKQSHFEINRITEQYRPLTGEVLGRIYHVRLSPWENQ